MFCDFGLHLRQLGLHLRQRLFLLLMIEIFDNRALLFICPSASFRTFVRSFDNLRLSCFFDDLFELLRTPPPGGVDGGDLLTSG